MVPSAGEVTVFFWDQWFICRQFFLFVFSSFIFWCTLIAFSVPFRRHFPPRRVELCSCCSTEVHTGTMSVFAADDSAWYAVVARDDSWFHSKFEERVPNFTPDTRPGSRADLYGKKGQSSNLYSEPSARTVFTGRSTIWRFEMVKSTSGRSWVTDLSPSSASAKTTT